MTPIRFGWKALWMAGICAGLAGAVGAATICETMYPDDEWFPPEGDVFPETMEGAGMVTGDGSIRFLDWTYIMWKATGNRAVVNDCEFTIADCSPEARRGDGVLDAADVLQAFRWALVMGHPPGPADGPGPGGVQTFRETIQTRLAETPTPNVYALQLDGAVANLAAFLVTVRYNTNELRYKRGCGRFRRAHGFRAAFGTGRICADLLFESLGGASGHAVGFAHVVGGI